MQLIRETPKATFLKFCTVVPKPMLHGLQCWTKNKYQISRKVQEMDHKRNEDIREELRITYKGKVKLSLCSQLSTTP